MNAIDNIEYTPEAIAARTRLEIWREILRHGGVDAETALTQAQKVWADLGFPAGKLDCWAVLDGHNVIQTYANKEHAEKHAAGAGLRAARIREVA